MVAVPLAVSVAVVNSAAGEMEAELKVVPPVYRTVPAPTATEAWPWATRIPPTRVKGTPNASARCIALERSTALSCGKRQTGGASTVTAASGSGGGAERYRHWAA